LAGNDKAVFRGSHRVRMRTPGTALPDRDFLQALLAFAFTIQQENQRLKGEISRLASEKNAEAESAEGIHVSLNRIVASAQNLTGAAGAALALGTEEAMVCVARCGRIAPDTGSAVPLDHGLAAECARTRQSVLCINAETDPRVDAISSRALGVSSVLYVPLQAQDELIGILGLFSDRISNFSSSDLQLLRYIAALVLEQLHKQSPLLQTITPRILVETIKSAPPGIVEKEPDAKYPAPQTKPASTAIARPTNPTTAQVANVATPIEPPKTATVAPPVPISLPKPAERPKKVVEPAPQPEEILSTSLADTEVSSTVLISALLFVLFAAVLGGGYYMRHHAPPIPTKQSDTVGQKQEPAAKSTSPSAAASLELGRSLMPGVRYWMADGRAMVTIALDKKVSYTSIRLHNPERVYFDITGLEFGPPIDRIFTINDSMLQRVRIGRSPTGVTRIVFDMARPLEYTASETTNPNGLVIEFDTGKSDAPPTAQVTTPDTPAMLTPHMLTVVIDPGHGGNDTGTIGHNGLQEKQLTLDIARRLGKLLEQNLGAYVLYTRKDDHYVSLENRSALARKANADFFISIHANASLLPTVNGVETYYFKSSSEVMENAGGTGARGTDSSDRARRFAAAVQQSLIHNLSSTQVAVRDRGVRTAPFVVLRDMQMPAVLAEISFISSVADEQQLRTSTYRDRIANALYQGIANNVLPKTPDAGSVATLTRGSASAP
jgi:N-acetylmuramoyl-L-alanine amidase